MDMKSIKSLLTLFLATISVFATAQKTADQVMKHVVDNIKKHNNVEIGIDYKIINVAEGINENENGTITLQGEAYRMEITQQTITSDGKSVWTYSPDNEEVMITDEDGSLSPMKLLETYKHHKTVFAKSDKGKGLRIIEITNSENNIDKITVIVDEDKSEIRSFTLTDSEGNKHVITMKEYTYDKSLGNGFFKPTQADYPGAEVIDMR
mgnify:CR=1 FL=1